MEEWKIFPAPVLWGPDPQLTQIYAYVFSFFVRMYKDTYILFFIFYANLGKDTTMQCMLS